MLWYRYLILIRFNKSLVAAYTPALRPDLLKIHKKIYIKTTCFWHELLDPRPCHPARLLDGASLMCIAVGHRYPCDFISLYKIVRARRARAARARPTVR